MLDLGRFCEASKKGYGTLDGKTKSADLVVNRLYTMLCQILHTRICDM